MTDKFLISECCGEEVDMVWFGAICPECGKICHAYWVGWDIDREPQYYSERGRGKRRTLRPSAQW